MNARRHVRWVNILIVAMLAASALTGCESEDSPSTGQLDGWFAQNPYVTDPRTSTHPRAITITPASATITFVGQQQTFQASGGTGPYSWDVADNAVGSIAVLSDSRYALYTASVVNPNSVICYDSQGQAGLAEITGPTDPLVAVANPSEITQINGRSILTATGGTPPYTWDVDDTALGNLEGGSPQQGNSVVYKASQLGSGDNTVRCSDGAGTTINVLIQQP